MENTRHFTGDYIHIVGTECGDRGCSCPDHKHCGSVLLKGSYVRIHLVDLSPFGLNEEGLEVRLLVDLKDTCRVGFVSRSYMARARQYDGVTARVCEVWMISDESGTKRNMVRQNKGYCVTGILGAVHFPGVSNEFDSEFITDNDSDNTSDYDSN